MPHSPPPGPTESTETKIDYMVTLLTEIRDTLHPPVWKKVLHVAVSWGWKILLLVLLSYYLSQAMTILTGFTSKLDGTEQGLMQAKDEAMKKLDELQFWK